LVNFATPTGRERGVGTLFIKLQFILNEWRAIMVKRVQTNRFSGGRGTRPVNVELSRRV
jgi:hypothetical protein